MIDERTSTALGKKFLIGSHISVVGGKRKIKATRKLKVS